MANVLPPEEKRAADIRVRGRFVFVIAFMLFLCAVVAALALVPSFLTLRFAKATLEADERKIEATTKEDKEVAARVQIMTRTLLPIANASTSVNTVLEKALGLKPAGISISTITYSAGTQQGTLVFSGEATTREAINQYRDALNKSHIFSQVVIPVGALVGAQEGRVSITLLGAF